jgi:hypothetical protein
MGQYYFGVILAEKSDKEYIRTYLDPTMYMNGSKLTEHSYLGNNFMKIVENLISPSGMFYRSRLVWAGDYADLEPNSETNLYTLCGAKSPFLSEETDVSYAYIVNHTKKVYIKKQDELYRQSILHPLPILTAEGNGRGGGDYDGSNMDMVGTWARDVISMEKEAPEYALIDCVFMSRREMAW